MAGANEDIRIAVQNAVLSAAHLDTYLDSAWPTAAGLLVALLMSN